jgi:hypothetical protein
VIADACCHRWRYPEGLLDAVSVVARNVSAPILFRSA